SQSSERSGNLQTLPPAGIVIFEAGQKDGPLLVSFPHDGHEIPQELVYRFTEAGQQSVDTDWHIAKLYEFIKDQPYSYIKANYSRYVVDLNRPADGAALYPGKSETSLCPVESFDGRVLYEGPPPDQREIRSRVEHYWEPYHDHLHRELQRITKIHGFALLWDAHSIRGEVPKFFSGVLPQLNFGTADGTSCIGALEKALLSTVGSSPFSYVFNGRFKGGYITRRYGDPSNNIHAVQLEINQQTYLESEWPPKLSLSKAVLLRETLVQLLDTLCIAGHQSIA
ncbi:MAG: N-formylglutamate deformylase, partial [Pseudomonadota bacterium]